MLITAVLVASMAAPAAQAKTGTPAFERPAEFAGRTLNEIAAKSTRPWTFGMPLT